MSQPEWEEVYRTDYSALFQDKTGEYPPELEIRQEIDDTERDGVIDVEVFRFSLDRLKLVADSEDPLKHYLVPEAYEESWPYAASQYEEWFTEDLPAVASSIGCKAEELIAALTGEDINARAWAYESIGGYFGFMNLSYPRIVQEEV